MEQQSSGRLEQLDELFNAPGLARHLALVAADAARRVVTSRAPDSVITAAKFRRTKLRDSLAPIEGSIMLFWARPGTDIISRLEKAYTNGELATLREVGEVFMRQMSDQTIPTFAAASDTVLASPMHFDLRYGSKVLSRTLTMPEGAEICLLMFPYNGGNLDEQDFVIDQHHQVGETIEYPTLVVKVPPKLSPIELEAIRAVPSDQVGINVGDVSCCFALTATILVAIALATHAGIWQELGDEMNRVRLTRAQLSRLGPMASAQELVALRREIFEAHGI